MVNRKKCNIVCFGFSLNNKCVFPARMSSSPQVMETVCKLLYILWTQADNLTGHLALSYSKNQNNKRIFKLFSVLEDFLNNGIFLLKILIVLFKNIK